MIKFWKVLCVIVSLCLLSTSNTALASENKIRVAFLPDMYGFYSIKENGEYSGYNYEYLMNLSQLTHWEYEFVVIEEGLVSTSLVKAQEMLAAGELDLLGPFSATSSNFDEFESGERSYGVYRYNLFSASNNYAITRDNYFLQDTLRVGLVEAYTDLNEKFFNLMAQSDLNMEITYVQTHGDSHDLLLNEQVDAIINLDMSINSENLDYLTNIDHIPFHFVSTKGNTELMAELDEAILQLEVKEPEIHQTLLEKYFGTRYDGEFLFTEEETALLDQFDSFKIGLLKNEPPYQYVDEYGNNAGISIDVMNILFDIIDKPYEIIWKDSHNDLVSAIENKEVDMIFTVPSDYTLANTLSVILTIPYISSNAYWVRSNNEIADPEVIFHFVSSSIPFYNANEISTTLNIEADLNAMNKSGTYTIFCDPNVITYYSNLHQYDNIEVKTITDVLSELSIGVSNDIGVTLVGVLNRAIRYIDSYETNEIVYKHTNVSANYDILDLLDEHLLEILILFVIVSVIIIAHIWNVSRKFRELSRRDSLTKLYNAGHFHDYVGDKAKKVSEGVLILIDIDYFKDVNDTHGHQMGDEIIKLVAKNLDSIYHTKAIVARMEHSTVARLGGDEFAVFVEGKIEKAELVEKSKELMQALLENDLNVPTTLSVGGFIFQKTTEYSQLFKDADKVLYQVKEEGRNGYRFTTQLEELEETTTFDHTLSHENFMRKVNNLLTNSDSGTCHALLSLSLENVNSIEEGKKLDFYREVSERLKHQVRKNDLICNRQNKEYLIFLDSYGSDEHVFEFEQRVTSALSAQYASAPRDLQIKCGITFALFPEQGKTYSELLEIVQK